MANKITTIIILQLGKRKTQKAKPIFPNVNDFFARNVPLLESLLCPQFQEEQPKALWDHFPSSMLIGPEANTWPKLSQSNPLSLIFKHGDGWCGLCQ